MAYMPPGVNVQRDAIAAAIAQRYGGGDPLAAPMPEQFALPPQAAGPAVGTTGWDPRGGGDMRGAGGTIGAMAAAPAPVVPTPPQQPGPIGQDPGGGGPVNLPANVTAGMDFGTTPPPPPAALPAQPAGWTPPVFGNTAPTAPPAASTGNWGGAAGMVGQSQVATPGTGFGTTVGGMNAQGLGQRA